MPLNHTKFIPLLLLALLCNAAQLFGLELPSGFLPSPVSLEKPSHFEHGFIWVTQEFEWPDSIPESIDIDCCADFELLTSNTANFGFYPGDVTLLVGLSEGARVPGFFELSNGCLDRVELYRWSEADQKFHLSAINGDQVPLDQRYLNDRPITLPATASTHWPEIYLFKVNNGGDQFHFDLTFKTQEQLVEDENRTSIAFGAYFGILLFVLVFNIFLVIIIREKISIYYALYILFLGLLQASLNGFGKALIWPDNLYLSNHANPIAAVAGVLFLLLFTRDFLNVPSIMPKMARILKIMKWVMIVNLGLSLLPFEWSYRSSIVMINGLTMGLIFMIIPIAITAVRKKFKPGRFFAAAFIILIATVFIFIFRNFGLLPSNNLTNYGMQYGSALEVILLSIAIVDRFKSFKDEAVVRLEEIGQLKQEANEKLEIKVAERTQEVIAQKVEIEDQKKELEEKNDEILSSITYAKGIQEAIMLPPHRVKELLPDGYISYLPKDIVAGDFFWMEQVDDLLLYAAADCTGHGVPGAMVSVVCHNALDRSVREFGMTDPAAILDKTRQLVVETFERSDREVKDGMDIGLVALNKVSGKVQFAGAHNSLYHIRTLTQEADPKDVQNATHWVATIGADRQPVGKYLHSKPFTTQEVDVSPGDMLVVSTDGFIDQFGGDRGKKLKSRKFKELLLELREEPMDAHQQKMEAFFHQWKGGLEQIDDVCFIAYRHPDPT